MPEGGVPQVSVLLPVRNAAATLHTALGSTLRSRAVSFEVLVLDHGSTDGSAAVAARFCDARVRIIDMGGVPGLAAVLNRGVSLARAPLLARMDADDVMHPERLAADVHALRGGALDAVASCAKVIGAPRGPARSRGLRSYVAWQNAAATVPDHQREVWIEQPLCQPATTFDREGLARFGGYRAPAASTGCEPVPEDYELFLRMLSRGARIEKRRDVHHGWREHAATTTRFSRDTLARLKARVLVTTFALHERAVIIAGAGKEGGRIARALSSCGVSPAAFVDTDPAKIGRTRHRAPVVRVSDLPRLMQSGAFCIGAVGTSGARPVLRATLAEAGFTEGKDAVVVA